MHLLITDLQIQQTISSCTEHTETYNSSIHKHTMATPSSVFYFFLSVLVFIVSSSFSASNEFPKTGFITLPINIEPTTHQNYTSIGIGTPRHNMKLASHWPFGEIVVVECGSHYNSSSYNPVPWDSPQCPHPEAYLSNCDSGLPFTALVGLAKCIKGILGLAISPFTLITISDLIFL